MKNKAKILDISKKLGLSHIGSCLSILPILEEIYAKKKSEDKVILDNAHAHLAHLVVKESLFQLGWVVSSSLSPAEGLIKAWGIHCDRKAGCDASGGSLGHGLGIGIGYALANPQSKVYIIVSDGSMMEGSNWEALRIVNSLRLTNLEIHCNFNGSTALVSLSKDQLWDLYGAMVKVTENIDCIYLHLTDNGEGFKGVVGHYLILK